MTREAPALQAEFAALTAQRMAAILRKAGQNDARHIDRLLSLFRDDRHVASRFDRKTGNWDGYQEDLKEAWDALDERLAAPDGDAIDPVPDLLRLALVRATLSSADDVPPALVTAAVRTSAWTVQRAASTITRQPSAGHRALMLSELLRMVPDDAGRRRLAAQFADLAVLPSPDLPAETLLSELDLLEPAVRIAVADRIAADATVLPTGSPFAPITGPRVLPETAVRAIETIPEARRPALLLKLVDSLLRNFTPSRKARTEQAAGRRQSLFELALRDMGEAVFDPRPALVEAAALLARLAGFLPALATAQQLPERITAVLERVQDRTVRDDLIAAFRAAFPDHDIAWPTVVDDPADRTPDEQVSYRGRLMGQIYERRMTRDHMNENDNDDSTFGPSLDELNTAWFAAAQEGLEDEAPLPEDEDGEAETADAEGPPAWFVADIQRITGLIRAALLTETKGLSDETFYQFIREIADPRDLAGQLLLVSVLVATEALDEAVRVPVLRKVRAGLLIAALDHHFHKDTLRVAWHGVAPEWLVDVEWDAVLAFVLTLPTEEQRDALHAVYGEQRDALHLVDGSRYAADAERIPRLAALRLVLPFLSDDQVGVAFTNLIALTDPWPQRLALEMLAPQLNMAQVTQALHTLRAGDDAREQGWFLIELARRLDPTGPDRHQIMQWRLEAITAMRTGADFDLLAALPAHQSAELASDDDRAPAEELPVERILVTLQGMDDNNRTDALLAIARATSGPLPVKIVEEALRLPVLNAAGRYSPRCEVIACLADRLPEETLAAVFYAAMELPHRLSIGDSQAWGWNWTYEYPRGSALHGLAPRLRGDLAEAAFTASLDLPWIAREDVLQRLAPHADGPLAAAMFDYSIAIHHQYLSLPDSERVPYPLEDTLVTEPIRHFKLNHEVHLAEMIAATASRLDPARLRRAVNQAQTLQGDGPQAWLPARLLPLLGEDQREPLLSCAVVAALEFIRQDPGRLDLVTDLLPYMSTEISRRRELLDRFLQQRFPGRQNVPTEEEFYTLSEKDRREYLHLTGADRLPEMGALTDNSDGPGVRALYINLVLSPVYDLQQAYTGILTNAPLQARVDALESMKHILEPGAHASVVEMTLRQVLDDEMEPMDRVRHLAALLSHLDQTSRDSLVTTVSWLPGPPAEDERELCSAFAKLILKEFGKPLARDPRFDEFRHSATMQFIRRDRSDHDSGMFRQHRAARVPLLNVLGPTLSEAGVADAVQLVRSMSDEMERADGIAALLPVVTGESRRLLRVALAELASPFARWLVLFNSTDALRVDEDPTLAEFARSTVEEFHEPKEVAIFLLLLIEYAHDKKQEWINRALALAHALPVDDQLEILAIAAEYAKKDPDLAQTVTRHLCALPQSSARAGWAMATRMDIEKSALTNVQLNQLRLAESKHLRDVARRGRTDLLRTLAEDSTAITQLTTTNDNVAVVDIARAARDICVEWRWPSAT